MCLKLFYLIVTLLLCDTKAGNDNALRINTDLTARIVGEQNASSQQQQQQQNNLEKLTKIEIPLIGQHFNQNLTNICTREENYIEEIRIPSMQPVRIRSSKWCLEFPPRCSNYKTEMREVVKTEKVNKTRTIRFCCDGYEGNISINDTICKPVCRGGCGRGHCQTPDVCSCEPGYVGKHCTQRCDHDRWGDGCKNKCECQNDAVCDNKSGLCHCTAGWTGAFCELPCPSGTHGIMCRNACSCADKRCHPKTGECLLSTTNVTSAIFDTLNSTIANITQNLDRIADKIVHIATSTTAEPTFGIVGQQETAKTLPEVIVIKQDDLHTPKIILHPTGTGLLDNLQSTAGNSPEVIHVITNWPTNAKAANESKLSLAGFGGIPLATIPVEQAPAHKSTAEQETNLLTTLLIILLAIVVAVVLAFMYIYRRYHLQRERVEAALAAHNGHTGTNSNGSDVVVLNESSMGKNFLKPLPALPGFTQMMRNKIEAPGLYDSPSNNCSIKTPPYVYARKDSLYSVVNHKSRKGSLESHLYDEIRYPLTLQQQQQRQQHLHYLQKQQQQHPQLQQQQHHHQQQPSQHQHHHHQQQQQQQHYIHQPAANTYQISDLAVPPQNANFLQVPSISRLSHKVAHI